MTSTPLSLETCMHSFCTSESLMQQEQYRYTFGSFLVGVMFVKSFFVDVGNANRKWMRSKLLQLGLCLKYCVFTSNDSASRICSEASCRARSPFPFKGKRLFPKTAYCKWCIFCVCFLFGEVWT